MRFFIFVIYMFFSTFSFESTAFESDDQIGPINQRVTALKSRFIEKTAYFIDTINDSPLGKIPNYTKKTFEQLNRTPFTKIATGVGIITMAQLGLCPEDNNLPLSYTLTIGAGVDWILSGVKDVLHPTIEFTYNILSKKFPVREKRSRKIDTSARFSPQERAPLEAQVFAQKLSAYTNYSLNVVLNTHVFLRYLNNFSVLYAANINPFSFYFPDGMADCTGGSFLCMPLTTPISLMLYGGSILYNLKEIHDLYKTGIVHKKDMSIFAVSNAVTLGGIVRNQVIPYAYQQTVCHWVMADDEIISCTIPLQWSMLIKGGGGYSWWILAKNTFRILKNSSQYTLGYLNDYVNNAFLKNACEEIMLPRLSQPSLTPRKTASTQTGRPQPSISSKDDHPSYIEPSTITGIQQQISSNVKTEANESPKQKLEKVKTKGRADRKRAFLKTKTEGQKNPTTKKLNSVIPNEDFLKLRKTGALFMEICTIFNSNSIDVQKELFPLIKQICELKGFVYTPENNNVCIDKYTFELPHGNSGELVNYRKRRAQKALIYALFDATPKEQIVRYIQRMEQSNRNYSLPGFIEIALFSRS